MCAIFLQEGQGKRTHRKKTGEYVFLVVYRLFFKYCSHSPKKDKENILTERRQVSTFSLYRLFFTCAASKKNRENVLTERRQMSTFSMFCTARKTYSQKEDW